MKLSGRTKIAGLFGYPVEHSLSPAMHNAAFEALGLDYCYVAFSVHSDSLQEAVKAIRALHLSGVNVTIPHKEKVNPFLDEVDREASAIGAVNTIVNSNGNLTGYNTDGRGFMQSFGEKGEEAFPGKGRQTEAEEELRQLRREIEILRQERDILKKVVVIFSKPNR